MADFTMTDVQRKILSAVPEDRLALVQYVGKPVGRAGIAPAPSGVMTDEFGLENGYGRVVGGQLLYALKEDAEYSQYFRRSKAKVELESKPRKVKAPAPVKKGTPGKVTVER